MERISAKSYRDLEVWQLSKNFALKVYKATEEFPHSEIYGLTSQMRRAAVSIPSNIAEGFRRKTSKDKIHFLITGYGSGAELETQMEIGNNLGYFKERVYEELASDIEVIMKMLNRAIQSLQNNQF